MSEFRQDIVSGDWIVMAPGRAKRPQQFKNKTTRKADPKSKCPFEDLKKSGNWPLLSAWPNEKNWRITVFPNKYPILTHSEKCGVKIPRGPYFMEDGVGHHDLIVTRDHSTRIADLKAAEMTQVLTTMQDQFVKYSKDACLEYVSAFMNWGPKAGGSLIHPHIQLLATPIIPADISHSLRGSKRYTEKHRRCPHCEVIRYEKEEKARIIAENASGIVVAPFASKVPFEIRIFPKRHNASFEKITPTEKRNIGALLQTTLKTIETRLGDPDLNFFIHSAPLKNKSKYRYYHWHIEVLPILKTNGGLELSTGVQVNSMPPEDVASFLYSKK